MRYRGSVCANSRDEAPTNSGMARVRARGKWRLMTPSSQFETTKSPVLGTKPWVARAPCFRRRGALPQFSTAVRPFIASSGAAFLASVDGVALHANGVHL